MALQCVFRGNSAHLMEPLGKPADSKNLEKAMDATGSHRVVHAARGLEAQTGGAAVAAARASQESANSGRKNGMDGAGRNGHRLRRQQDWT